MNRTKEEIHKEILSEIPDRYDKTKGNGIYDITGAPAVEFEKVHGEIGTVESKLSIENLSGDELAQRVFERTGIKRHEATNATTVVVVTGDEGANIHQGDEVATETQNYQFLQSMVIGSSGRVNVEVEAIVPGSSGNTPSNSINQFPVTLEGLTSVTNPEPATNGYNAESDDSLLGRYYDYLQAPATSGNKAHYRIWAMEVPGVGDAKVFPTWNGGGTVKVMVIDANKRAANEDLVSDVYNHIEDSRPIGATVTVESGIEIPIDITANIVLANGYTISQVQSAFVEEVIQHLKDIAYKETYVSYARSGNLLLETLGVGDYADLTLNESHSNVLLKEGEVAVIGTVTLGVA